MSHGMAPTGPRRATDAELPAIIELLRQASLPTSDLEGHTRAQFWVTTDGDRVTGAIGLERHGEDGLLRSLVVDPADRDRGTRSRDRLRTAPSFARSARRRPRA